MAAIRIPIVNTYGGGSYTAKVFLGSANAPANVIVDTGSSTLAVRESSYKPKQDANLKATSWAQYMSYVTGRWAGPLVKTNVAVGAGRPLLTGTACPLAIAPDQELHSFAPADGILGLAYNPLNEAYNLSHYLKQNGVRPPVTFPWPFPVNNTQSAIEQLEKRILSMPKENVAPFFTELVREGKVANKFAFYTHRSAPKGKDVNDPANHGVLVLGGGEEQTDLYDGAFANVNILHDTWYNTNLERVHVAGQPVITAKPLPSQLKAELASNSILDSGTNSLALSTDVFKSIMKSLGNVNSQLLLTAELAIQAQLQNQSISSSQVHLKNWPNISFILSGKKGEDITLTCSPQTYWQIDAYSDGKALFQINDLGQDRSILGLPLFNNYYIVFDRSADIKGVARFASIK